MNQNAELRGTISALKINKTTKRIEAANDFQFYENGQRVYSPANKPAPADLNVYSKPESDAKFYHAANKPTAADCKAIDGISRSGALRAAIGWQVLARVRMPQSASTVRFSIYGGAGFNTGNFNQCGLMEVICRSGNNNPKGITIVAYNHGGVTPIFTEIAWKLVSGDDYDIYVKTPNQHIHANRVDWYGSSSSLVSWGSDTPSDTKPSGVTDGRIITNYNEQLKPTAVDVGALPLSGGTVTGLVKSTVAGNAFETQGGYIRSNAENIMSMDGKTYSFVTSRNDAHLCQNAYWDGQWKKYSNSDASGVVAIINGELKFKKSAGGATDPNQYQYMVYHQGFKPTAADVGLPNVPNTVHSANADANTVAVRDGAADLHCRLVRSGYPNQSTISGALAFRVNNGSDNYVRFCSDTAAIRTWLGVDTSQFLNVNQVNTSSNWSDILNKVPKVTTSGVMEVGKYIDLHETNSTKDFDVRLTAVGVAGSENLTIQTANGLIQVGAMNTSAAHFYTDRALIAFNKQIQCPSQVTISAANGSGSHFNLYNWGTSGRANVLECKDSHGWLWYSQRVTNAAGGAIQFHINGEANANSFKLTSGPQINAADAGSIRIQSANGYVDIGPKNTGHCHFYTDRPTVYFDKPIVTNGNPLFQACNTLIIKSGGRKHIRFDDDNGAVDGYIWKDPGTAWRINHGSKASSELQWTQNGELVTDGQRWAVAHAHGYANQPGIYAPVTVNFGTVSGASDYYPIVRGISVASGYGYTTQVDLGCLREGGAQWGRGILRVASHESASHPSATYVFTIEGDFTAPRNGNFNDVYIRSDARLKSNLAVEVGMLEKVKQLVPVTYDKKATLDAKTTEREFGLIAQEVEKVIPLAVGTDADENKLKALKPYALIAALVGAVKELAGKVEYLESQIR